jgi:competence/damage-inducible protein CinA-like protein
VTAPKPRAIVVLTGSELVRGDRADENGVFLARELSRLGLAPARILLVGDDPAELEDAVREGFEADLCILSGGLGPTHDDRTVETMARAAGVELEVDETLEREIEAVSRLVARRVGRPYADFSAGVRKQASVPAGGLALGLAGTAPAVLLERDGQLAVALPGPPNELRRLWPRVLESAAMSRLLSRVDRPSHRLLRLFGPGESSVASVLEEAGGEQDGLEVTVCAHDLEIRVDVFARPGAEEQADRLAALLAARFESELFAEDERQVAELVLDRCRALGLTLATAESCTGGLVGARLTDVPGSSDVYLGGVVAYSNEVKRGALGVSDEVLSTHGSVSAEAAGAMAEGARSRLGTDVAVAVTGVAGPGGGTPDKPVGLVYFHAAGPRGEWSSSVRLTGDREAVRARATALALHGLRTLLTRPGTDARGSSR